MATAPSLDPFVAAVPEQSVSLVIGRACAQAIVTAASQAHGSRGILLGHCTLETPAKLVVEDQEMLPEQAKGLAALDDFERICGQWKHDAGRRIFSVGFWAARVGVNATGMTPHDLLIASKAFHAPWNTCILVNIDPETQTCQTRAYIWSSSQHPVSASSVELALGRPAAPAPPAMAARVPAAAPPLPAAEVRPRASLKRVWIPAAVVATVCAPTLIVYSRRSPQASTPVNTTVAPVENPGLELTVTQPAERMVMVRWNRGSSVVTTAQSALLSVIEGGNRRDLDIDLALLKGGSIVYSSTSDDVEFRLNVMGPDWKVVSECVRLLGGTTAPPTLLSLAAAPPKQKLVANSVQQASPAATPQRSVRPFQAPAVQGAVKPQTASAVLEAPPSLATGAPAQIAKGLPLHEPAVPRWTEPPKQTSAVAAAPAVKQAASPQALYEPPKALRKVLPQHPTGIRLSSSAVEVSIEAHVETSGNVTRLTPTPDAAKVPADFVRAAMAAARQWRFSPATLGGKPVAAEHLITFRFIRPSAGE